jgi:peptidoglycan hydrolase CwlO-like protein
VDFQSQMEELRKRIDQVGNKMGQGMTAIEEFQNRIEVQIIDFEQKTVKLED